MNKNDYTYNFHLPMMDEDIKLHLASTWQKRIRYEWQKINPSQVIIVLDLIVMKSKHYTNCVAQIVKLNITNEEIATFVRLCNEICHPIGNLTTPKEEKPKKKIAQYDTNGHLIKIWDNQSEAAKALGIGQASISLCVNGKTQKAGGFIFEKIVNDYGKDI